MKYIAVDCHISTLEFAVVDEAGCLICQTKVETGAKEFLKFVHSIKKPRKIFIEEGMLAGWLKDVSVAYGEDLVVTDPKINRWIAKSDKKDDRLDAVKLAHLARGGYVKEIYHPVGRRRVFKELVFSYHDTTRSITRIKNKIKAKFRQNGIACSGKTVYLAKHRKAWQEKLSPDKIIRLIVDGLWEQLDKIQEVRGNILERIRIEQRRYPEIKSFRKVPGIGLIHAVTVSAIIENPHRFSNKKKVWMYAGLGVLEKSSGNIVYSTKLNTSFNRLLKWTIKQATESAISSKDNPFRHKYLYLILVEGVLPHRAKLTISRNMLSTMYGMWKRGEEYNPAIMEQRLADKKRKVKAI